MAPVGWNPSKISNKQNKQIGFKALSSNDYYYYFGVRSAPPKVLWTNPHRCSKREESKQKLSEIRVHPARLRCRVFECITSIRVLQHQGSSVGGEERGGGSSNEMRNVWERVGCVGDGPGGDGTVRGKGVVSYRTRMKYRKWCFQQRSQMDPNRIQLDDTLNV